PAAEDRRCNYRNAVSTHGIFLPGYLWRPDNAQRSKQQMNLARRKLRTRVFSCPRAAIAAVVGLLISVQVARAADLPLGPQNAGPVASVTDGRTFILADGRTVRLAMIEVPALPPPGSALQQTPAGDRSRAALGELVDGQNLLVAQFGADRFGRVLARAYLPD